MNSLASIDATLKAPHAGAAPSVSSPARREDSAARAAATQFEAILLRQLTASLAPPADDDEESLFGGGEGLALSRQLFSEQLADTLAQSGGIGLADVIMSQLNPRGAVAAAKGSAPDSPNVAGKAAEAVRLIRDAAGAKEFSPSLVSEARAAETPTTHAPSNTLDAEGPTFNEAPHVRPRRVFPAARHADGLDAPAPPLAATASAESRPAALASEGKSTSPLAERVRLHMYVKGAVRSNFGVRVDPFTGTRKFHSGVDIPAPRGTPIGAAAEGRVVFSGRVRGYGKTVVVEHADGSRTRYAHAERLLVRSGDSVRAGETIATVGSTGRSTGPHLHFEVTRGGRHLNPLKVLAKDLASTGR